ncbi:MAG TPA: TIGR03084 family metal-binding protein [Actinomycetota bacterium]|nr:TIGR03084 family metal-binding protein [Actinomycetota bacterium]
MVDIDSLCTDLYDEHASLDEIVLSLDQEMWDRPTPAEPWSIRDQISHLAFFDEQATLALLEPDRFNAGLQRAIEDLQGFMDAPLEMGRALPHEEVLGWWRGARTQMLKAFYEADRAARVPWFGPPMSLASFISARLMETWAHGQDVADALLIEREPTDRLQHVCHLGVRARRNSYAAQGREFPGGDVRVELKAPSGEQWTLGESTEDIVRGPALDFCLVVTQRRHLADTALQVEGDLAKEWMSIAQAFAGPPGPGRTPGQFRPPTT